MFSLTGAGGREPGVIGAQLGSIEGVSCGSSPAHLCQGGGHRPVLLPSPGGSLSSGTPALIAREPGRVDRRGTVPEVGEGMGW